MARKIEFKRFEALLRPDELKDQGLAERICERVAEGERLAAICAGDTMPAMEFTNGRFWCGLARNPSEYLDTPAFGDHMLGAIFAQALGLGRGCDSHA